MFVNSQKTRRDSDRSEIRCFFALIHPRELINANGNGWSLAGESNAIGTCFHRGMNCNDGGQRRAGKHQVGAAIFFNDHPRGTMALADAKYKYGHTCTSDFYLRREDSLLIQRGVLSGCCETDGKRGNRVAMKAAAVVARLRGKASDAPSLIAAKTCESLNPSLCVTLFPALEREYYNGVSRGGSRVSRGGK